jgi:hypothetical protein
MLYKKSSGHPERNTYRLEPLSTPVNSCRTVLSKRHRIAVKCCLFDEYIKKSLHLILVHITDAMLNELKTEESLNSIFEVFIVPCFITHFRKLALLIVILSIIIPRSLLAFLFSKLLLSLETSD